MGGLGGMEEAASYHLQEGRLRRAVEPAERVLLLNSKRERSAPCRSQRGRVGGRPHLPNW